MSSQKVGRAQTRKTGFTLIELLVVIAIIAILAAILFPVFARARENARRASCQSNVKQIMLGVFQYTQDYDEKFPMAYNYLPQDAHWHVAVAPYLKSGQIWRCPSDADNSIAPGSTNVMAGGYHNSYGVNVSFGDQNSGTNGGISLAQLNSSSETVYMADAGKQGGADGTVKPSSPEKNGALGLLWIASMANVQAAPGPDNNWVAPNPRHLDTVVVGFADGHVKSLRPEKFFGLSSAQVACYDRNRGCGN